MILPQFPPLQPFSPADPRRRALWIVLAACGGLVLLLSGLWAISAIAPTVRTAVLGMPHVWVGADDTSVVMIQVTRQGNSLSGTLDETGLDNPGSTTVTPVHEAFTGTIDGSAITLTFPQGFGFTTSISGTLSADTMTLNAPDSSGSVASITLKPASVDAYNRRTGAVRASARANADASASAAAAAADAAARQQTEQQIQDAAATVAADVNALQDTIAQGPDFSSFDNDLAEARNDLETTKADAAKAATESDAGLACGDAGLAKGDAGLVQGDAGLIEGDTGIVNGDVSSVNAAIDHLKKDLSNYQQAAAALPTYTPTNPPDASAIQSLVDQAAKATSGWKAKAAEYQSKVNQVVASANDVAAKAQNQYC